MVLNDVRYTDIGVERTIQPVAQCMSQDCLNMPDSTIAAEAVERVRSSQLPNGAAGYTFARGLALGHIDPNQFFRKHVRREPLVGLTMGVVLATIGGLIAYF